MKNEKNFWYRWILYYSLGELLGIGAAAIIARFLFYEISTSSPHFSSFLNTLILVLAGSCEGLIIGYIQEKSFSKFIRRFKSVQWITVTVITTLAGWLMILPPAIMIIFLFLKLSLVSQYSSVLYTFSAGFAFGGMIGIGQYFIIRQYFNNSLIWILSNGIAWAISFLFLYGVLEFFDGTLVSVLLILLACMLSGLFQGIITGTSLHRLMSIKSDCRKPMMHPFQAM